MAHWFYEGGDGESQARVHRLVRRSFSAPSRRLLAPEKTHGPTDSREDHGRRVTGYSGRFTEKALGRTRRGLLNSQFEPSYLAFNTHARL